MGGRKPPGAPFPGRNRKPWALAAGAAAAWLVLYLVAGSWFAATMLLAALAAAAVIAVLFLRSMGVTRDHPWIRQLESRPWRDGQAVLQLAMSHLQDVFVIAPSGSLYAPTSVELQMNQEDLASLRTRMDLALVTASATEFYEQQVVKHGARFVTPERAEVYVVADELVPRGRYRLRQGNPAAAARQREFANAVPQYAGPDTGFGEWEWREPGPDVTSVDGRTVADAGPVTVLEQTVAPVPVLRLVTGDLVAQTRATGAEAGRGAVELTLPNVPTISRRHARFAFADGRWRVTNLGMNGLTVNGTPAADEHPLGDGDIIRWGSRPDAVVSRVEIG